MDSLDDVTGYYSRVPEESRLGSGVSRLEFERTKEILSRVLPAPPSRVVDVGGGPGFYSAWLAERGYEVHLIDATARLVEKARDLNTTLEKPIASISVGDARSLSFAGGSAAAVLVMGPLYHLTASADRETALREASRVLMGGGCIVAAAISRYASSLDGMARKLTFDPAFVRMRDRDLRDGQHRNETDHPDYFTTAYFHRPEDLHAELEQAGFREIHVMGVEGPAWLLQDFDARWDDPIQRKEILDVTRALESEPSILGASAHLLGIGRKPGTRGM